MNLRRRIRASAGQLGLVALLTFLAATLVVGAPRVANRLTDEGLHTRVEAFSWEVRDLTFISDHSPTVFPKDSPDLHARRTATLSPQLRQRIEESWWSVSTLPKPSRPLTDQMVPIQADYTLRAGSGQFEAVRVVAGRLPNSDPRNAYGSDHQVVEVVLTQSNATRLQQQVGHQFLLAGGRVRVVVVGIVAPLDQQAAIWAAMPYATEAFIAKDDDTRTQATYLADLTALSQLVTKQVGVQYELRYRLDVDSLDMTSLSTVVAQVQDARQLPPGARLQTSLDTMLTQFADEVLAGQALLAIVQAGTLATLAGLVLLAAALAVGRRRGELTLLRARGASLQRVGLLVLCESLPVVPVAALAGALVGSRLAGRAGDTTLLLLAFTAAALGVTALLAMLSLRHGQFVAQREDGGTDRVGLRRRTAEVSVLALAALGVWLLRRRGVSTADGVDIFLVSVPALFAAGAAVLAMRAAPGPLRWSAGLAARGRGAVAFLGLAQSGRAATRVIGPVAVLVVAVCTTVFSIAVSGGVDAARDKATNHATPGDILIEGGSPYDPATTTELRALPDLTVVSPFTVARNSFVRADLKPDSTRLSEVYLLVVDAPTFVAISRATGHDLTLPAVLTQAQPGTKVPAVVSSAVAADLAGATTAAVELQSRPYDFTVAQVVDQFPLIPTSAKRFVVLPWQALPTLADRPLDPGGFLIAGSAPAAELERLGDAGQQRWISSAGVPPTDFIGTTNITTWAAARERLEHNGINQVLTFAYQIGTVGGIALALLAVAFAVLAGARARGRVLSRLRTMGLSRGQGRRLLLIELAPVLTAAVLTGAVIGAVLPYLIGPALRLTVYTAGWPIDLRLDPLVLAGTVCLVLAGLVTAVVVETIFHRRQRLGEVLRLGEES